MGLQRCRVTKGYTNTWYPCQGSLPLCRKMSVYARDSRSSLLLAVLPKCAWALAYRTVPLKITKEGYKDNIKRVVTNPLLKRTGNCVPEHIRTLIIFNMLPISALSPLCCWNSCFKEKIREEHSSIKKNTAKLGTQFTHLNPSPQETTSSLVA